MTYEQKEQLENILNHSEKDVVFLGGAGVSTESGIPDFRSENGLYNQKYDYAPEEILSLDFFNNHTREFFNFYKSISISADVKPNKAHEALADMEQKGRLLSVITQNIDGLHQKAGSKNVIELHGNAQRYHCTRCKKEYPIDFIMETSDVPKCECGKVVRPDIVLYGECLPKRALLDAECDISCANTLIVGGTSLNVYPAAGLISRFHGTNLIIMNNEPTPFDDYATMVIRGKIGENLSMLQVTKCKVPKWKECRDE